jgi:hypothetical protein
MVQRFGEEKAVKRVSKPCRRNEREAAFLSVMWTPRTGCVVGAGKPKGASSLLASYLTVASAAKNGAPVT